MKSVLLFIFATTSSFSALAYDEATGITGNHRVECKTSYPRTGAGIQNMTLDLIDSQAAAGFKTVISTSATKVGWVDVSSDHGQVAVCVTAKK